MSLEYSEHRDPGHTHRSQPLLLVAIAVGLGILANRLAGPAVESVPLSTWWLVAMLATLMAEVARRYQCARISFGSLLIGCSVLGALWHDSHWNYLTSDELALYSTPTAEPVCVEATAVTPSKWSPAPASEPLRAIPGEPRSEVEIRVSRVRDGTDWRTASGRVRLRVNGVLPDITPGDQLLVFARLSQVTPAMNPGQYDFAAAERAAGRHCELFTQSPAAVSVVQAANAFPSRWFATIGRWCQRQTARYVGWEQQAIAQALILGVRGELDEKTMDAFMKTGTIHLLVVSGMHVGLIATVTWFLIALLPVNQQTRLAITALVVISYAAVVGAQPSVIRSTVLVLMTLLALARLRHATSIDCLAGAALLVLMMNPNELFRPGTQLSFLGVSAVIFAASIVPSKDLKDPLERMIRTYMRWPELAWEWLTRRGLSVLFASAVVWLVVSPLVMHHFHIVSPSASPLTLLAWPMMSFALISGLAICSIGFLLPPLAWVLGKLCGGCLWLSNGLIEWGAHWPASYFYGAGPDAWWLAGFYGALGLLAIVPSLRPNWKTQVSIMALWISVGLVASLWNRTSHDELRCSLLSVGHGTCVVLELPSGETLLYDAGSLGSPTGAANTISSYLWSRGISHIDAIVISHADVDHYNAVPELMERFDVSAIYVSPLMFDPWATGGDLSAPNYLKERIDAVGVRMEEIWMNDRLRVADERVNIEVLHPPREGVPGRDNANSVLLLVEFGGLRILLPGDLESPGIEAVMAEAPLDVDILLAPHHGSRNSDPPGFAQWCTPEWVVLSGRDNPDDTRITTTSYREAGAEIFHTAKSGAVEFSVNSAGIRCQPYRQ